MKTTLPRGLSWLCGQFPDCSPEWTLILKGPELAVDPQGTQSSALQNGTTEHHGTGVGLARVILRFEAPSARGPEAHCLRTGVPQRPAGSAGSFTGPYLVRGSQSPAGMPRWEFLCENRAFPFWVVRPARPRREDGLGT